jgi:hypothetical protein
MSSDDFSGSWGAWQQPSGSNNGMRVGIEYVWRTVSHGDTSAVADIYFWTQNRYNYSDNQTINYSSTPTGYLTGSTDYTNNTGPTTGTTWDVAKFRARRTVTSPYTWADGIPRYGVSPRNIRVRGQLSDVVGGITPFHSVERATPARPATNPSAPTSMSSTPNNGSISVSFGGPTFFGGANPPVSGDGVTISYYQYSTDNATWDTVPANPFNVSGTNGTAVTVYVRAVNNYGLAGTSASTTNTPRTVPSAPTSFSANSATFGQITLSWGAPSSNGGSGVTSYVLRNGSTVLQNSTATSYTHTGLAASTTYSYTVTAANVAGESTASSISATTIGGYSKVWDGTSWVTLFPKVWTGAPPSGSGWVEAQARVWNGSEWKHGI